VNLHKIVYSVLLVGAVGALAYAAVAGQKGDLGWHDQRAFVGTSVRLPVPASGAAIVTGKHPAALTLDSTGESARLPQEARGAVLVRVTPKDEQAKPVELRVSVIDREYGLYAGIAGLVVFFALLFLAKSEEPGMKPLWMAISEKDGSLSLGRAQLLLWFVPAVVIFCALSVPLLEIPRIEGTLAVLFGLAGLTRVVGGAANPPIKDEKPVEPELGQLITGWDEGVDVTRVQYLAISVVGAIVLLAAFASDMRAPPIPEGFLALIGASQAAYLGSKAVSTAVTARAPQSQ